TLDLNVFGSSVLTTVCGISSRLVQVTVVPAVTGSVTGVKLKLSIFTSVVAGGCVFAAISGDPLNRSPKAINTSPAQPKIDIVLLIIIGSSLDFFRIDLLPCSESFPAHPSVESTTACARWPRT